MCYDCFHNWNTGTVRQSGGACLKWEVDGFGRIHPAKQVQFAGISWLMPSVKSHHARLCNHPVDNARFMGFLAYGVACSALWIGAGQRSVTVLTSNRFPCPNDTLHDVDEWFSFAVSIQRGVSGVHADDVAWCDHMFSRVNSSSFLSGIIDWSYVHRRFSFLKHDNLMAHHVKAFWIVHHIVVACLIALTDALMIGNAGILLVTGLKTLCFSWWNDDGIFNASGSVIIAYVRVRKPGMSLLSLRLSGNQSICQFIVAGLPGYRVPVVMLGWARHAWHMSYKLAEVSGSSCD